MREQSGRSLVEIIGVLAIGAIMVSAVFGMYHTASMRQKRLIATENLRDIASKTKILLEYSGYTPVSVDFLIKSGVLLNDKAPLGDDSWSVTSSVDGLEFSINVNGLSFEECTYFATKKLDWVTHLTVNGHEDANASYCLETGDNKISFFAQ